MTSLRARVIRGRLIVDEPTDLPEGSEVELTMVDDALDTGERARVDAALDEALVDLDGGDRGTEALAFIGELRARR